MSPQRSRVRTVYVLIGINVVLACLLVIGLVQVVHIRNALNAAEERNYAGCLRGNVLRELGRFAATELGSPERAAQPELQAQPCALIYPGGSK